MSTSNTPASAVHAGILTYLGISALVYLLMMVLGIVMRMTQATWLTVPPDIFYQIMTAHGAGMVGISGLAASAIMWHFLSRHVRLCTAILWANLAFFLFGVVLILGGIFLGGYAGGWTFLFPLPAQSGGVWGVAGAASFTVGLLLIGVGFLLLYLDAGRAIISRYGSLSGGLGWPQLFGNSAGEPLPSSVVASTMVVIVNIAGITSGAVVLVLTLVNLFMPQFEIDALLAKNLIYFFGHVFINATIYQAVIAVYSILPEYTGRPWKVNKVFLAAWTASTVMVLIVYPHHLLMDFAMPTWALLVGQVVSYLSGLPVLLVTAYGTLTIIYRSGIRWDTTSRLLFLSILGWAVGVIPAVVDGTINVNHVMHNTMWVPGHFHMYLIVGLVTMVFGFMYYVIGQRRVNNRADTVAFWVYAAGGIAFSASFLAGGYFSVPRRWAQHLPEWVALGESASVFAILIALGVAAFTYRFLINLRSARVA